MKQVYFVIGILTSVPDMYTMQYVQKLKDKISPQKPTEQATQLLTQIRADLQTVRTIVVDTLEKGTFNQKDLDAAVKRLSDATNTITVVDKLDQKAKDSLKQQAQTINLTFQALQEEAGVLSLWSEGFDAYIKDLDDNFKNLPLKDLPKPDYKKLYEELGFKNATEGQKASFNGVRQNYQQRFNNLQAKAANPTAFDNDYFRPYLRVLDYIFKTPYSKLQYDAFLAGPTTYNNKAAGFKKYGKAINKLFLEDLSHIRFITGILDGAILRG